MSANAGPEFEVCMSPMCREASGKTSSFSVKDRGGKRGSNKLLISDRQSSLSCDSIVVEWSCGVCELSLWHVSRWGWRWAKKTYRWTRKLEEQPEEHWWRINFSGNGGFFLSVMCLPPLTSFSLQLALGVCEHAQPLHFRKTVCFLWKGCYYSQMVTVLL